MLKQLHTVFLLILVIVLGAYIAYREGGQAARAQRQPQTFPVRQVADMGQPPLKVRTFDVPEDLNFAGEQVPTNESDVLERFDREVHVNTYWHSSTIFLLKRAARWLPQFEPILRKHNIPEDFKYLAVVESGLMNVTSPAGAKGFWQLMPRTAEELGMEVNREVDQRYDPIRSAEAACQYFLDAYEKFGSWTKVAASYNMGMHGLERELKEQKAASYYDLLLNEETSRYIFRILAIKEIMENPEKFGYVIPKKHLYEAEDLEAITVNETIPDLVDFALENGVSYKTLKIHNPWLRKDKLTVRGEKAYQLLLPKEALKETTPEDQPKDKKEDNRIVYNYQ